MFFDRVQQKSSSGTQVSKPRVFLAPSQGWIRNQALANPKPGGAEIMDNWFPTPEGCRIRKGSDKVATLAAACTYITSYKTDTVSKLFATDAANIYDVTSPASTTVPPTASVTSQTSGDWSSVQFTTAGGSFLVMVNGSDPMQQFDGSVFYPMPSGGVTLLPFDAQTANFTVGDTLTGGTSAAHGTIVGVVDSGATGTVYLKSVTGTFQDNETITDAHTGSATSNIPSGVTSRSITGVDTSTLSHVWRYSSRLWFVGAGFSAWYLDALAIGGAATEFPLQGVFGGGGELLFGASYSMDAGAGGLDDYCLFVSTEGEVAIYKGDPASTFEKVGVYRIGRPLHKNASFRAGGDLGVLTDDGINSVQVAIQKDRAGALGNAITYPIEEAWRLTVNERNSGLNAFTCAIWPSKTMLVVGIPATGSQSKIAYVSNTKNGAWCRFTGWDIRALHIYNDRLFFGTPDGYIIEGEVTGADMGAPYSAIVIPKFQDFGDAGEKATLQARIIARANNAFTPQLFANADYQTSVPTALSADSDEDTNSWDSGTWGVSVWGAAADTKARVSEWQGVAAVGQALAPGLQVTTGRTTAPDAELVALHLVYEAGGLMG